MPTQADPSDDVARFDRAADRERRQRIERLLEIALIPQRFIAAGFDVAALAKRPATYADAIARLRKLSMAPGTVGLIGPRGTGKTFLACATVRHFCENGQRAMYHRAIDFFVALKDSFGNDKLKQRAVVDAYRASALLVLDEMQVRSDSEWENTMLTDLIDRRYGDCKSTILIANLTAAELGKRVGESIVSRMSETGGAIVCDWDSFRARKQ